MALTLLNTVNYDKRILTGKVNLSLPLNGLIFVPEIPPSRSTGGIFMQLGYEDVVNGETEFVVVKNLELTARGTYIYEDSQALARFYVAAGASVPESGQIQLYSY